MRLLLAIPVLVLLVLFALSNKQPVEVSLWPTDVTMATSLSLAVLLPCALFFLAGALMTWGTSLAMRARARRAEEQVRQLRTQVRTLEARPVLSPGAEPRVTVAPPSRQIASGPAPQGRPMAALPRG